MIYAICPRQLDVRDQEPTATPSTDASLKRHEDSSGLAIAGDAFTVEKLDTHDSAAMRMYE